MTTVWSQVHAPRVRRLVVTSGVALAASVATFLAVTARAAGVPAAQALTYTGYLETPDGKPQTDEVAVSISVWNAVTNGKALCSTSKKTVAPVAGRFQITLPEACTEAVAGNPDLWLEAVIDGTSLGRTKLGAVPYAIEASHAVSADSADGASGALATRLDAVEKSVEALTVRSNDSRGATLQKFDGESDVTISSAEWTWVAGTDAADLAPGRYWVFTAAKLSTAATGCTVAPANCKPYAGIKVAVCMKVDGVIKSVGAPLYAETSNNPGLGVPVSAFDYLEVSKPTAKAQLGMCAAVPGGTADTWFTRVRAVQTVALPQLD